MIYYGIRRKDGAFMPQGRGRGFTHDQPTFEKPPRLFTTRAAAQRALDCWLMGEWTEERTGGSYPFDGYDGDDVYPAPPATRPLDRHASDMEVVVVEVVVRPSLPAPPTAGGPKGPTQEGSK